jgi:putative transcriptional regulator
MFDASGQGRSFTGSRDPLPPGLRLLLDTQAAIVSARGDDRRLRDVVGGAALEAQAPAALEPDALERVFARIDDWERGRAATLSAAAARAAGAGLQELLGLPEPVREHALVAMGARGWANAGPGLRVLDLDLADDADVQLLRIEPGHGAPRHDHTGVEHTLVITGAFADGVGRFGPGEVSTCRPGQVHRPIAEPGAICFALTVSEGQVAFTGALGLLQRLFTRH